MKCLIFTATLSFAALLLFAGCNHKGHADGATGAPPPAQVERENGSGIYKVERTEQFPLVTAGESTSVPELTVTGAVRTPLRGIDATGIELLNAVVTGISHINITQTVRR